jgi:hypothetical protein
MYEISGYVCGAIVWAAHALSINLQFLPPLILYYTVNDKPPHLRIIETFSLSNLPLPAAAFQSSLEVNMNAWIFNRLLKLWVEKNGTGYDVQCMGDK